MSIYKQAIARVDYENSCSKTIPSYGVLWCRALTVNKRILLLGVRNIKRKLTGMSTVFREVPHGIILGGFRVALYLAWDYILVPEFCVRVKLGLQFV